MDFDMKIGIDLDGVVIDSEKGLKTCAEIFDCDVLKGNNLMSPEEWSVQDRYAWSEEQKHEFLQKYLLENSKESHLMAGFKQVYRLLKDEHEFVAITARGGYVKEMKEDALRILQEDGIAFDKYYWRVENKLEICQKEKVDLMIDDNWRIVKTLAENKIKTLYFRDMSLVKLQENEYIKEVNDWGEVYRYLKKDR